MKPLFYMALCAHVLILVSGQSGYTPAQLQQMLSKGIGNIEQETINGPVTLEEGEIPSWLSGNFIRHACGVYGEVEYRNYSLPNYIGHLFDCIEIGQKFRLENGQVTFTNKWYDTTVNDIYNFYGRDMNKSSVFDRETFSKANKDMVIKWSANMSDTSKVTEVPHVSWWKVGNEAVAMTETPIGVVIDPETVTQQGYIVYNDDNFGIPRDSPSYMLTNNPAHEQTEADGTLWSTVAALKFVNQTYLQNWRIVYKVGADHVRHMVGEYHYDDADLTKCVGNAPYPQFGARFGYLHSFCMTEKYVILPEAAYMHDPCAYTHYKPYEPFFPQGFHYEEKAYSRLLVMRKTDGHFVANITVPGFFVTHQFGSYEDGELIHMDMLMYNDASIYETVTLTDSMLNKDNTYTTNCTRITINMTDFTATTRNLRTPDKPAAAFEMSNINYAYSGRKYTYGYIARNFDLKEQNAITKLNVDTGAEIEYLFPEGMYVQEPQFIPKPGGLYEDDGVILAQGFDGRKAKAFMVVIDAKDMTLLGHVTAPDIALFGIHNRFYPLNLSGTSAASLSVSLSVCTVLFAATCALLRTMA